MQKKNVQFKGCKEETGLLGLLMPRTEARHPIPPYLFCPCPGYKYTLPAILDKMMKERHAAPLSVEPIYLIYKYMKAE